MASVKLQKYAFIDPPHEEKIKLPIYAFIDRPRNLNEMWDQVEREHEKYLERNEPEQKINTQAVEECSHLRHELIDSLIEYTGSPDRIIEIIDQYAYIPI